jgi:hypothetical protein
VNHRDTESTEKREKRKPNREERSAGVSTGDERSSQWRKEIP